MKTIKLFPFFLLFIITSCSSVSVNADYDKKVDFTQYKTYAYAKAGIDKVEISDLDKRRILHAIDDQMLAKGFTKSETPDLLISFSTKAQEAVYYDQFYGGWGYYGWGWGYGWNPYWVSTYREGTLYIDLIDAKKKELVWQGVGYGTLSQDMERKEQLINEFVTKIFAQYPPSISKK